MFGPFTPPGRLAVLLPITAAAVCAAALAAALRTREPPVPGPVAEPPPLSAPAPRVAMGHDAILSAVARNPFRPDRRRAPDRYRMPGSAAAEALAVRAPPPPAIRLHGTAALGRGDGFAALAVPGRTARILRVGQELEGLRLVRVDPGSATLENADNVVVLQLAEPSPSRGSP